MALFAFDPNASIDVGHVRDVLPRDMERFMARISVVPDDDLVRHFPQSWPALLAVETSSGRREKLVLHVPGDPERPFDEFQVAAKFWRLVAPRIGERSTEDLLRLGLAAFDGEGGARSLLEAVERAVPALRPA
jgi:2-methylcitrate dehydratase PrpD